MEFLCRKHWAMVSKAAKRALRRWTRLLREGSFPAAAARRLARRGFLASAQWGGVFEYVCRRYDAAWERCKREAIERAAGL